MKEKETPQSTEPAVSDEQMKVDFDNLIYQKLLYVQNLRTEHTSKYGRLKSSPYDKLTGFTKESFIDELRKIDSKTSTLSSTLRAAITYLRVLVIQDLVDAQARLAKSSEETVESVPSE